LQLTKIFHFEMAHAIHGYEGACRNIHGHSYELHVTVTTGKTDDEFLPSTGIMVDFKELKSIVHSTVIQQFDHHVVLSKEFVRSKETLNIEENLYIMEAEPTAENLLIFIKRSLKASFPQGILLASLKLYETKDSYAEWFNTNI